MTLLKAVDGLNSRIDSFEAGTHPEPKIDSDSETRPREMKTGNEVVDNLGQKVFEIERDETKLEESLDMLVKDILHLQRRWNLTLVSLVLVSLDSYHSPSQPVIQ